MATTEDEQLATLRNWWQRNGNPILLGTALALLAVFGWRYFQNWQENQAQQASAIYQQLLEVSLGAAPGKVDLAKVSELATQLKEGHKGSAYEAYGRLLVAKVATDAGRLADAAAELQAIVEEAAGWQTYVMAHAYTPQAISRAIKVGIRTIEHGNLIDEATARQAKDAGTYLVPTVVTYEALANEGPELGLPADSLAKVETVRTAGKDAIAMLHRVGVKMGYGSDLLGPSQRHQASELRIRAEIIGNLAALQSATTVAAEILNRDDLGVVKPGALADLLIVRGDPLQDIGLLADQSEHVSEHLLAVMKDGQFITNTLQSC